MCKPTGKVGPNTSSTTTAATVVILGDDFETGSIANDGTAHISPNTKPSAAAGAVAVDIGDGGDGSSGSGINDLGAAKGNNERSSVKKASCLRRLLAMYCGEWREVHGHSTDNEHICSVRCIRMRLVRPREVLAYARVDAAHTG